MHRFEIDSALDNEWWAGFHFHKRLPDVLPKHSQVEEDQSIGEEQNDDEC